MCASKAISPRPVANAPDDAAQAVNPHLVKADLLHLFLDDGDDLAFLRGKGRSADQVGQEADGFPFQFFGSLLDGMVEWGGLRGPRRFCDS